jgi:hypothetical protein
VSESNSTRKPDPDVYREHARAAIAAIRTGGASLEQEIVLARLRVRMHARANRHELGTWQTAAGAAGELVVCVHCGARAYLDRATAREDSRELYTRRCL